MARYLSLAMSVRAARGIGLLVAPLDTTRDALVHGKRRPRADFVGREQRPQPGEPEAAPAGSGLARGGRGGGPVFGGGGRPRRGGGPDPAGGGGLGTGGGGCPPWVGRAGGGPGPAGGRAGGGGAPPSPPPPPSGAPPPL